MKGTKKQHFVPQLLLRQFADAHERLFTYDKARDVSFPTRVRDSGHQNHFLSIRSLDGADGPGAHFERLFQTYETPAMDAIRGVQGALAAGVLAVVGSAEREALSRFVAVQFLRTPEARDRMLQTAALMQRTLMVEIGERNGFDVQDASIAEVIDRLAAMPSEKRAEFHGSALLQPQFIDELAAKLSDHVWLVGVNNTGSLLYVADHPVALHGHAERAGRGLGPASYGVETVFPLSSTLQLSLVERRFVREEAPSLEAKDGQVYAQLSPDNVLFQRAQQVKAARQFVYCAADDFADAKRVCEDNLALRDPNRPRVEVEMYGDVIHTRAR